MSSLSERPEILGFFSYSREDDADSGGNLSKLRDAIQHMLGEQLALNAQTFRLWQDQAAIGTGKLWESEIAKAIASATFFFPIVTPRSVRSPHCRQEFEAFLTRERELGRDDLIFPIYYIFVPALGIEGKRANNSTLAMIAERKLVDWRSFRHQGVNTPDVAQSIEEFCGRIVKALKEPWLPPKERLLLEQKERKRIIADAKKRAAKEVGRKRDEEAHYRAAEKRRQQEADDTNKLAEYEARRMEEVVTSKRAEEQATLKIAEKNSNRSRFFLGIFFVVASALIYWLT